MFDTEKTKAFFGLAAPFIEKFRLDCPSEIFDTPEAVAWSLSPLVRFGLWNLPGLYWASGLPGDGGDSSMNELLHDAIFRSEDFAMHYPLLDSGFSRGGVTKLLMNVESGPFYPHPWLDPELLAQAKACREVEIDLVELHKHDGDYRYGEHAPAPLKAWVELTYPVLERLVKKCNVFKRAGSVRFDTLTAFLTPSEITAATFLAPSVDSISTASLTGRITWVHFEHFVSMAVDELMPVPEVQTPATGDYRDIPSTSPTNGNGHKAPPSIAQLASAFGQTVVHQGDGDPLRDAFERSQLAPKFERELLQAYGLSAPPSQIVVDTVAMVEQLQALGITADKALDAAVQLLKPVPSKDGN